MRIVINDFAGHPFQFQLSRELARRGHSVMHTYLADLSGPKGHNSKEAAKPEGVELIIEPVSVGANSSKYSYSARLRVHHRYVQALRERIGRFVPDVVISGNMPTDAQYRLNNYCKQRQVRFVHWMQDFYSLALETLMRRRFGVIGKIGALPFHILERQIFKRSDTVVYISEDFARLAASAGYVPRKSVVIENWASLEDLPVAEKDNHWSREYGLNDKFVFLYSGTMGLKHNPRTISDLARRFKDRPEVRVVVISEGIGRDFLQKCKCDYSLDNLLLLGFQPYSILPQVLASADVLLASVEPDSSVFSVPSKVLTYLCAGRPVLVSVPEDNLAARIVSRAGAGHVCNPLNPSEFLERAEAIWGDRASRQQMGLAARKYAEFTFDITKIGGLFESAIQDSSVNRLPLVAPATMRASQ